MGRGREGEGGGGSGRVKARSARVEQEGQKAGRPTEETKWEWREYGSERRVNIGK